MATLNYLAGKEAPTAELMNAVFEMLDAKLTLLLGGRSFWLAQTAPPPHYLTGKAFFFTAGPAVYAPRVPGYIETNSSTQPVARPYNHDQFTTAQAAAVMAPGYLKSATIQQPGQDYLLNDVLTASGGTLAAGGAAAQARVTQRDANGKVQAVAVVTPGSYTVLPPTPNPVSGGQGSGAWLDLDLFQYDIYNKVAPIQRIDELPYGYTQTPENTPHYAGLPYGAATGLFEWSLAAHSVMHQGRGDLKPVRYYLQDGTTMPEKHFRFAVAEIIIEGVPGVTIEKSWDKYACFRIHNLNGAPATVTFVDGSFSVSLTPYQCVTVRRDWDPAAGTYGNYRRGFNYFFKFEGGDPRFYWFFPTDDSGNAMGFGGKAANSMQANNLVNPAIAFDWILFFQRTADGSTTFASWNEDAGVQCDIYGLLKNFYGDPGSAATLVGDLIHHRGDVVILRRPKKIYRLAQVTVLNGGKNYQVGNICLAAGGTAIRASFIQVLGVDAEGGITSAASANSYDGYCYPDGQPPFDNIVTGGSGAGAILGLRYNVIPNDLLGGLSPTGTSSYGIKDSVTFKGYATIATDFAAKQLSLTENAAGNLVLTSIDPNNDVYLFPISTNLFKTAETNPVMVDLTGTNSFTLESAIFETEPEQAYLDNFTPLTSAPQLIQQPVATTTTPSKTWFDVLNTVVAPTAPGANYLDGGFAGDGVGHYWIPTPIVTGAPQTTLNWNTNARGLLSVPTILDGGSGYQPGDVEQLTGGSGDAATVVIIEAPGGHVTQIATGYAGNYASAPNNPNFPTATYPAERRGTGLILGGITIPIKTFAGVHKTTVADLLKLDWWGDPRLGDQNSDYVSLSNRKLTFTPQGLVLTFTEQDSPLPGDANGQPATLPTWVSGRRGNPRTRQIRFRLQGWGYCGVPYGSGNVIPPSGKTAIWSPTQGRQSAAGAYRGEVVAPNGADFYADGWVMSAPTKIKILTRIEPLNQQSDGRFWKLHGDNLWGFVYPATGDSLESAKGIFGYAGTYSYLPVLAVGLVVEMYNALARSVNSITKGTPLMWQCLFFNVGGFIVNLDPNHAFPLVPLPGTPLTWLSGWPTPVLNSLGQYVSGSTGYGCTNYNGPKPINQFAAFDQESVYQRLCDQLGIPVRTENDLPGGHDGPLAYYQGKYSAPAVYYDFAQVQVTDASGTPAVYGVPANDPSGNGLNHFNGSVTMNISTELLSTAALLAGQPTGGKCLGTYDRSQWTSGAGAGLPLPGGGVVPPGYPDFTNAPDGSFYVADDGTGAIATPGQQIAAFGEFALTDKTVSPVLQAAPQVNAYSCSRGVASVPGNPLYMIHGFGLVGGVNLNAFIAYRWVQIEDIQNIVTKYGFPFLWAEVCTPLELKYFEDPTQQAGLADRSEVNAQWQATTSVIKYPVSLYSDGWYYISYAPGTSGFINWTKGPFADYETCAQASINQSIQEDLIGRKAWAVGISQSGADPAVVGLSGYTGAGTLIKFCVTTSPAARWKIAGVPAPTQAAADAPIGTIINGRTYGYPAEIANILCRHNDSPLWRYLCETFSVSVQGTTYYGGTPGPSWGPAVACFIQFYPADQQTESSGSWTTKPTDIQSAQIAVQYRSNELSDLIGQNYSEGSLMDQVQVLGINIYSSHPIAPLPVLLSGQPAWAKQKDWWAGNLNTAFAASYLANVLGAEDRIPWLFVPPPASLTQYVTNTGLNIISAALGQRYWCCFRPPEFDLRAVQFSSQSDYFGDPTTF